MLFSAILCLSPSHPSSLASFPFISRGQWTAGFMRELILKQPAPAVGVPFARSAPGQVASSPQASVFSSGQWDGSNAGPACLLGLV